MTIYQYLKYYLMPFNSYSLLSAKGSGLFLFLKGNGGGIAGSVLVITSPNERKKEGSDERWMM